MDMHLLIIYIGIKGSCCYSNYDIFKGFDSWDHSNIDTKDSMDKLWTNRFESGTSPTLQDMQWFQNTTPSSTSTNSTVKTKMTPFVCPEELATNIGTYEVPTDKDIVVLTKDVLSSMFELYERDAMALLMDIKEVTKAAAALQSQCPYNKQAYRQCVKQASGQSEGVTKSLVTSLQMEKADVKALTDVTEKLLTALREFKVY